MNKIIIGKDDTLLLNKDIIISTHNLELNITFKNNIEEKVYIYLHEERYKKYNIILEDYSNIEISIISSYSNSDIEFNYTLLDNSKLNISKFNNVASINEITNIHLLGYNSSAFYNFSTISDSKNVYTINVFHKNKNTTSSVINNAITTNMEAITFNVNASVLKGCKNSNLDQSTKIINFYNNNSMIYPNLFVDEYDVSAEHGAYIGNFKNEDIFYLMSRGINYKESINLLVKGFVLSNLTNIDTSYIIQRINDMESEQHEYKK